jgi:hypothetical protein
MLRLTDDLLLRGYLIAGLVVIRSLVIVRGLGAGTRTEFTGEDIHHRGTQRDQPDQRADDYPLVFD